MAERAPFKQLRLSNFFCSVRNDMSNANDRHNQNDSTSNRQGDTQNSSILSMTMRRHRQQQKACFWKVRLYRVRIPLAIYVKRSSKFQSHRRNTH